MTTMKVFPLTLGLYNRNSDHDAMRSPIRAANSDDFDELADTTTSTTFSGPSKQHMKRRALLHDVSISIKRARQALPEHK